MPNEEGTPQGGSISVLLSNLYLHYVLELWFEQVVKPRLRGEASIIRYLDDFVVCSQYQEDAKRVSEVLPQRLEKYALTWEPSKTKLIEFGRIAERDARAQGKGEDLFPFTASQTLSAVCAVAEVCSAVNQRLKRLSSGKSARYVLWEPVRWDSRTSPWQSVEVTLS
jgi:hypothetical protein